MTEPEKRSFTDKFMLRLPDGLRERIKILAEKRGRSMNAEIVHALERHLMYSENSPAFWRDDSDYDLDMRLDSKTDMAKEILKIIEKYLKENSSTKKS